MNRIILTWLVAVAALVAGADTYPYLKLVSNTGAEQTVSTDGLKLVFEDGNLVATHADGTTTIDLLSLDYMEFTSQAATLKRGDINGDGVVDVSDLSNFIDVMLGNASRDDYPGECNLDGDEQNVVDVSDLSLLIDIILGDSAAAPSRANEATQQTMWVCTGQVKWAYNTAQLGQLTYTGGTTLTVQDKTFAIADIDSIVVDNIAVADNTIDVNYNNDESMVTVAGNTASHITAIARGGHIAVLQDETVTDELTYTLSGKAEDGSFYMDGSLKITLRLNGVSLNNPDSAAINICDGKRIAIELVAGTVSNLVDGAGGKQKGCVAVKGHGEFKGDGTLNITGNTKNAYWGKEYVEFKKTVGTINILGAVGDGFNVNQYVKMNGGTININNVGDDGIQLSYATDDDDNIIPLTDDEENTGVITIKGGTLTITTSGAGTKAITTEGTVNISGGTVDLTANGTLAVKSDDLSYCTGIKADEDINITGGTVKINNTAPGGKGLSADGNITINENDGPTVIEIAANGEGGVTQLIDDGGDDGTDASYKMYFSLPAGGGGYGGGGTQAWTTLTLYKSDGTQVSQLNTRVTLTASNGQSTTFYYYDFGSADEGSYYLRSADYTSRGGWGGGSGTTYTIRTADFNGPTSGSDYYYAISNSYTTSGTVRTYTLSNVTSTYNGSTSDTSEENGTGYHAAGIKADGDMTIDAGSVTVSHSGAMSKGIRCQGTMTVNGGTITLVPSGAMMIISNDASYCTGIKANVFEMNNGVIDITASGTASRGISADGTLTVNGGTLTVVNSANGYMDSSQETYTAKALKSDSDIRLLGGTITLTMSGTGGKGIKCDGNYIQGTEDGNGPTLTVHTTGAYLGNSSGGGMGPGWGGQSSSGSSAKGIKALGTITIYGGTTEVTTTGNKAEGLESKTSSANSIDIRGGQHYFRCYDDCINSAGAILFNGGVTVCYSTGNDAVDSNYGRIGAVTIGDGTLFTYTGKGGAEMGIDCDNNSYISITGSGNIIAAGGNQGGGGGWGGSGNTLSNASQGYYFYTTSTTYSSSNYYSITDSSGKCLITFKFEANVSNSLSLFSVSGMKKGSTYYLRTVGTAPSDATTAFHGVYLGSSQTITSGGTAFTAQ